MTIAFRPAFRWWAILVAISGVLSAAADGSAFGHSVNAHPSAERAIGWGGLEGSGRLPATRTRADVAMMWRPIGLAMLDACSTSPNAVCPSGSLAPRPLASADSQSVATSLALKLGKALGIGGHSRVRVTRLQNGSILCCRAVPPVHVLAVHMDANDDTASDGDDSADDDDSQDDQNGNDDYEVVAWIETIFPYAIVFDCVGVSPSFTPSFAFPLATFKPLRC